MKILVLSLLRLGDFLMVAPALSGLKTKYPNARLDVLVHSPVARLQPMFPDVDRWLIVDRDELQAGLGRADLPLLTSFDVLRSQCDALNGERYDLIVNLTQTHFSGLLMGYLSSRAKLGLTVDTGLRAHFHSPWFRYLNQKADTSGDVIHYTDIFASGCEVGDTDRRWNFIETEFGLREIECLDLSGDERVTVQALTSDVKKNWGVSAWTNWLNEMGSLRPRASFVLLGAPNERPTLEEIASGLRSDVKERAFVATPSLEGALSLLRRSDLLVTGDTSIKHLANAAGCRVVELSLGSSDYRRTGIYKYDSLIIQGAVECAPCVHSSKCPQVRHLCGEAVPPSAVARAIDRFLDGDWEGVRSVAGDASVSCRWLRTRRLSNGLWFAGDISCSEPIATTDIWLERAALAILLNGADRSDLPRFGSAGFELSEDITGLIGSSEIQPILDHLDFLEVEIARKANGTGGNQPPAGSALRGVVDLGALREQQIQKELRRRELDVKSKLVRSLKSVLVERI